MMSRADGYFGDTFKGQRGVTQFDLLSPTAFNVVVDAVLHLRVSATSEVDGESETEDFGRGI